MVTVEFTPNLRRHVDVATCAVHGATVRAVLDAVFTRYPALLGYVLDDQRALRKHVNVFVAGIAVSNCGVIRRNVRRAVTMSAPSCVAAPSTVSDMCTPRSPRIANSA